MGKGEQKQVNAEATEVAADDTPQGVTVGMGVYKPIPRFNGNCPNC